MPPTPRASYAARFPFLKGLEPMRLRFGKLRGQTLAGARPSFALGAGLDFREFRHYAPGDDLRYLDWNALARLDQLYLKQFETWGELTLNLVIDRTPSMDFGGDAVGRPGHKLTFARRLAAALGFVALNGLDRVRLLTLPWLQGQQLHSFQGRDRVPAFLDLMGVMAEHPVSRHTRSLREMLRDRRHHHLVAVISDFQEPETWFAFISFLRRHVPATFVFHLIAPEERRPDLADGEVELRDLELPDRRSARIDISRGTMAAYRQELERHLRRVRAFCDQKGVGYMLLDTATPLDQRLWSQLRRHGLFD